MTLKTFSTNLLFNVMQFCCTNKLCPCPSTFDPQHEICWITASTRLGGCQRYSSVGPGYSTHVAWLAVPERRTPMLWLLISASLLFRCCDSDCARIAECSVSEGQQGRWEVRATVPTASRMEHSSEVSTWLRLCIYRCQLSTMGNLEILIWTHSRGLTKTGGSSRLCSLD